MECHNWNKAIIEDVAAKARLATAELAGWVDEGYDVIALIPSCALMLKFEWPLILPDDETVTKVSEATHDITEYIVDIARKQGPRPGTGAARPQRCVTSCVSCQGAEYGSQGRGAAEAYSRLGPHRR